MPNAPAQSLNTSQQISVKCKIMQKDGVTEDVTSQLVPQTQDPGKCTAAVDPADNRTVIIKGAGSSAGSTFVVVTTSPLQTPAPLSIQVQVAAAPPNLSRVDFVSATDPVDYK